MHTIVEVGQVEPEEGRSQAHQSVLAGELLPQLQLGGGCDPGELEGPDQCSEGLDVGPNHDVEGHGHERSVDVADLDRRLNAGPLAVGGVPEELLEAVDLVGVHEVQDRSAHGQRRLMPQQDPGRGAQERDQPRLVDADHHGVDVGEKGGDGTAVHLSTTVCRRARIAVGSGVHVVFRSPGDAGVPCPAARLESPSFLVGMPGWFTNRAAGW